MQRRAAQPEAELAEAPSAAAVRMRRLRARRRKGYAVLRVLADVDALAGALMDAGMLAADADDRRALEAAVAVLLDDWTKSVTRHALRDEARGIFRP